MKARSRKVERVITPEATSDGAGVKLKRSIATGELDYLDPFLLFDHFGSDNADDFIAGFPLHPHRGIETVTYMLAGRVDHRDSIGHSGSIGAGDIQWMTAGSGILHEEMPQRQGGRLAGFQLWVNLPAKLKMTKPRYQEYSADKIPELICKDGAKIKIIAGSVDGKQGPIAGIAASPSYLDITLPPAGLFTHPVPQGHSAFAYAFEGSGEFGIAEGVKGETVPEAPRLVVFGDGDSVGVHAGKNGVRFLLVSGKPLNEPVVRHGPFVMNTQEEIRQTLLDLRSGKFAQ